ncbi:Transcriptional regulator PadR-like family protein [Catalinimonas alkaloidigena]|uniref:Transcriptional regulator PadR-like family protein n=1 Tax=Catalinimonas alkaloidigena TaxID=1075417 RepID=A0A1G9TYB7_9BACT|nr:helix-turn-helix transcriptional regulator [Catalinimonas alkaloidigena]SDM52601.1 Transcriptional regulator PadR-like family protein [Catalinimonas alkaloidigena]
MKAYPLGEFEEIVLLTVGVLYDEAYGVAIKDEIEERAQRNVSVGALQSALRRLEQKGYLTSRTGDPTEQRGGKPKRYFTLTAYGKQALQQARDIRVSLWEALPRVVLDLKIT